ncbi:hypothetical protein [Streptobacillus moniliformis]|uniref:hypothetical protein n=1 Tax=Streptobacillus moniliformis TaxID=34105 RepID=UPI0007E41AF4|nr:hypothetical protein [Streptobacillus moniliformis]
MRTKIDEFLKSRENYTIYTDISEIPEYIKQMIYEDDISIGYSRDLITPLSDDFGLEKLFRYIKEYQPRTYEVLKDAKNLMYGVFDEYFLKYGYEIGINFLAFELNGIVLLLDRDFYGKNPGQSYFEIKRDERNFSLPKELVYSYYYEFIGLGFPNKKYDICLRNLPKSSFYWDNLDGYLEEIGIKKKRRIEVIKSYTKYFSKLLNTENANAEYLYSFMNTNIYGPGVNDNDYAFFVFEDIKYGDIYVIRNGDYERPKRLLNPVEAIDKYVAHVLSGEDNFNFDEYLEELDISIEEIKVYELVELTTRKTIIKDKEKIRNYVIHLSDSSEDVYYKTPSGEYEDISHFEFNGDEIEIIGFVKDEDGNTDFNVYYSYKKGKHLLTYSKLYETELEKGKLHYCLEELSNKGEIKEKIVKKDETKFYVDLWKFM